MSMVKSTERTQETSKDLFLNLGKILTFNRILVIIIVFGILFRINTYWTLPPNYDGNAYIAEGHILAKTGKVMTPWGGDFGSGNATNLEFTRLSPIFPLYLAAFYLTFGFSIEITQIAGIILGIITLLVIYLATKNLFVHQKGLIVTAIMSVSWPLILFPGMEWGDNMVLIFFVATLWAFMKGLKDSKYMIPFGLFSAILILTKVHGINIIFIFAVVIGFFLWRFYFRGREVFKDKHYYLGVSIFVLIMLGWYIRNITRSLETDDKVAYSLSSPTPSMELLIMFVLKLPFLISLAAVCFLFWYRELRAAFTRIKQEDYNVLWIFTIGFFLLIWVLTALMGGTDIQDRAIVFRLNHIRYIAPIYVSILWLVVKDNDLARKGKKVHYLSREMLVEVRKWIHRIFKSKKTLFFISACSIIGILILVEIEFFIGLIIMIAGPTIAIESARKRLAIILLVFFIVSVNSATTVRKPPYIEAGKDLQELLNDGDTIMVDGGWQVPDKFALYPYLAEHDVQVMSYDENLNSTYIFSYENRNYTGYTLIGEYYWDGKPGLIIVIRNEIVGLFISRYSEKDGEPQELTPSAWLWKKS